jgi:N-succinyldiaminopimelate aminotransferase
MPSESSYPVTGVSTLPHPYPVDRYSQQGVAYLAMPRHPEPSRHARGLTSDLFSDLVAKAEAQSRPVVPLHVGNVYRTPPSVLGRELGRQAEAHDVYDYAPPAGGAPRFLKAIQDYLKRRYSAEIPAEQIQVTPGGTAGFSIIVDTLIEPGEEVLLPSPFWPLSRGIIASRGATPVEVPWFTELDKPNWDPERALEEHVSERTSAIYVNTPHNPTGRVLSDEQLELVARFARRHGLWILSDDAYEDFVFTPTAPSPLWQRASASDRTVSCHTLAKSYSIPGARVGYVHGPPEAMKAIRDVSFFRTYGTAHSMQLAGAAALDFCDDWVQQTREMYHRAGREAADKLRLPRPDSGTFLFFDVSALTDSNDCRPFLHRCAEQGVLLVPGAACGAAHSGAVRLCYTSVLPELLHDGLDRIAHLFQRG